MGRERTFKNGVGWERKTQVKSGMGIKGEGLINSLTILKDIATLKIETIIGGEPWLIRIYW